MRADSLPPRRLFLRAHSLSEDMPYDLNAKFDRLKTQVSSTYNPNHRHDEEHEKERDRQQAEICASHRFNSFAMERTGGQAKWYIDGHDYFYAVSEVCHRAVVW